MLFFVEKGLLLLSLPFQPKDLKVPVLTQPSLYSFQKILKFLVCLVDCDLPRLRSLNVVKCTHGLVAPMG